MGHTPEGARLIKNDVSMAPGYYMDNVYVMAGVPRIMRNMLAGILPLLTGGAVVKSQALTTDLPEGVLAEHLSNLEKKFIGNIDIGSYPKDRQGKNGYIVNLIIRSSDEQTLITATQELRNKITTLNGKVVDGEADEEAFLSI